MPSASSIADGPVKHEACGAQIFKNKSDKIWVGSEYDSLHGSTLFLPGVHIPPIGSPAAIILVRSGRVVTLIGRHSSFEIRSGTLCRLSLCSTLLNYV